MFLIVQSNSLYRPERAVDVKIFPPGPRPNVDRVISAAS